MSTYVIICTDPDGLQTTTSSSSSPPPPEDISVSTVAATAVGSTGHHLLKVSDYSLLKATNAGKNGSCIESRAFTAGGHAWKLRLFLNGATPEHAGFVSLHLSLAAAGTDAAGAGGVLADFEFALVHHAGTLLRRPPSHAVSATRARTFSAAAHWGWQRFVAVEELERSGFLRDDRFAVRCRVTVVEQRPRVEEGVVLAQDVQRLGLLCRCTDAACRRHHATPAQTLWEGFARLCRSIFE